MSLVSFQQLLSRGRVPLFSGTPTLPPGVPRGYLLPPVSAFGGLRGSEGRGNAHPGSLPSWSPQASPTVPPWPCAGVVDSPV